FLAPMCGAVADLGNRKKTFLGWATALGVITTAALFLVDAGQWRVALVLFVIASVAFYLSMVFYDSLLVTVAPAADYDRVSARGYALGYLGGGLLLSVNVGMVFAPGHFGLDGMTSAVRWTFVTVALLWAVFAVPLFLHVREPAPVLAPSAHASIRQGLDELARTLRRIRGQTAIITFL